MEVSKRERTVVAGKFKGLKVWGKRTRKMEAEIKQKHLDGLTTSVHSHCSMSSMTEDLRPTPYKAARPPQRGGGGAAMP